MTAKGAGPDHVRVKSSSCCFPRELVSFVRPKEVVSFDPWHVTSDTPPIGKRFFQSGILQKNNNNNNNNDDDDELFYMLPDLAGSCQGNEDHIHLQVCQRHQKKTGLNIPAQNEQTSREWGHFNIRQKLFRLDSTNQTDGALTHGGLWPYTTNVRSNVTRVLCTAQ